MGFTSTMRIYLTRYIQEVTRGNVTVEWDSADQRVVLGCKECKSVLAVPGPTDDMEVRYDVQEFAKLHRHQPAKMSWGPQINSASQAVAIIQNHGGWTLDDYPREPPQKPPKTRTSRALTSKTGRKFR